MIFARTCWNEYYRNYGIFAYVLILCCQPLQAESETNRLQIFVSVPPQQSIVQRLGGDAVEVHTMVRPGHNPATYEPSPRQVAALAKADLYVRTGVPFEQAWIPRIQAINPDMPIVDAREGLELRPLEAHEHAHEPHELATQSDHQQEDTDPHIWTDPRLVITMTQYLRDQLIELRPGRQKSIDANYQRLVQELNQLDGDIRAQLADLPSRRFLVYHPAWGYFAAAYGLTQISIEKEGKEPGARALTALIEQAKQEKVKVILVQPQFNQKAAQQVAQAIGGRVETVDPLAANYPANLRRITALIAEAVTP